MALAGADTELVKQIYAEKTTEGAVNLLGDRYNQIYKSIGEKVIARMEQYTYGEIKVDAIMYAMKAGVLFNSNKSNQ